MGQVTHKMSYSKIYRTWIAMLSRCRDKNNNNYKNYGGRGIGVCERWYEFENFYHDMGDLPFYEAQIDRIDNNKGYFKENCRWVTSKENCRNKRSTKKLSTHIGQLVQAELIEELGWSKHQFRWYMKKYGISWILEAFKTGNVPKRVNIEIDRNDIVGKNFGKWTVIKFVSFSKKTSHLYLCQCECGKEKNIPRHNLVKNKSLSCRSCSAKNNWKKRKA